MAAIPLKPAYGPTLGRLLSQRWRVASRPARALALAALGGVIALVVAAVLTVQPASFSRGGPVPFGFRYAGLYRTAPQAGGYVRVARHLHGHLEDSFEVAPLRLPPYRTSLNVEFPLYAPTVVATLQRRYGRAFRLDGEGPSLSDWSSAYNVFYTVQVEGHDMYGRDVLMLPERHRARAGVLIAMLMAFGENHLLTYPLHVGGSGVLQRPLESFRLG